ncbi:MAG: 3'-5' exonuclease [Bacteroidetes bacterium]|nr:MAG: 3'-5' exonuclease [Bacteroidota bacterium]
MLTHLNKNKIIFLDIETVAQQPNYAKLPERLRLLWDKKAMLISRDEEAKPEEIYERAGIYSEFGKIICISIGYYEPKLKTFRLKSFFGHNEKALLLAFAEMLNRYFNHESDLLCAHNGKEFDFPYIARRLLVNQIKLPKLLDIAGKKPWEIKHLDTMELWKFGDYKHYTSLDLLTAIFNIPSPKSDINGSQVNEVYWKDGDVKRIAKYCQNDVLAIAQLLNAYQGKALWKESELEYTELIEIL